jgi:hypothetical protein
MLLQQTMTVNISSYLYDLDTNRTKNMQIQNKAKLMNKRLHNMTSHRHLEFDVMERYLHIYGLTGN